jgi:hypothetical protein
VHNDILVRQGRDENAKILPADVINSYGEVLKLDVFQVMPKACVET